MLILLLALTFAGASGTLVAVVVTTDFLISAIMAAFFSATLILVGEDTLFFSSPLLAAGGGGALVLLLTTTFFCSSLPSVNPFHAVPFCFELFIPVANAIIHVLLSSNFHTLRPLSSSVNIFLALGACFTAVGSAVPLTIFAMLILDDDSDDDALLGVTDGGRRSQNSDDESGIITVRGSGTALDTDDDDDDEDDDEPFKTAASLITTSGSFGIAAPDDLTLSSDLYVGVLSCNPYGVGLSGFHSVFGLFSSALTFHRPSRRRCCGASSFVSALLLLLLLLLFSFASLTILAILILLDALIFPAGFGNVDDMKVVLPDDPFTTVGGSTGFFSCCCCCKSLYFGVSSCNPYGVGVLFTFFHSFFSFSTSAALVGPPSPSAKKLEPR